MPGGASGVVDALAEAVSSGSSDDGLDAIVEVRGDLSGLIPGERTNLTVEVKNSGSVPFFSPERHDFGPTVITLELLNPASKKLRGRREYPESMGHAYPEQAQSNLLQPGQSRTMRIDLTDLFGQLPVGKHEFVVHLRTQASPIPGGSQLDGESATFSSQPFPIHVGAARLGAFTALRDPLEGTIAGLAAFVTEDGQTVLMSRETLAGHAGEASWNRRRTQDNALDITDVALTAKACHKAKGRWFAWIHDGKLTASAFWALRANIE